MSESLGEEDLEILACPHCKAAAETDVEERDRMYREMQDLMEESGAYRFITHEATPLMYRTSKVEAATRPDGHPLHRFFKSV